ncbi:disks large 1 tumor suppressor protein [Caerostris darwini]|uniref:Disks large 1 tumor suppressor protein n=1 Tax=Caerostris darwini TaxID=1538125 RepID=A0AAV4UL48_9ARAC|nr:disks large 1 tumor suppressor protein [Caerostris darwini]
MDVRSIPRLNDQEAHRALELLEEYHCKLTRPQDKQLRNAIERVIKIFKCRLFQALLDIQEFYEITLLDESKSIQQKTAETLQIACKWENSPPLSGLSYLSDNNKDELLLSEAFCRTAFSCLAGGIWTVSDTQNR